MSLSVGIVGLPNAGKSTLFNALAARKLAETAPRPFTTIEPHEAVVPVPDENLEKLRNIKTGPNIQVVPATVTFIDIAGLVKGAHKGEGLGNKFLAKIREVDAIVHVVRGFADPKVIHPNASSDPGSEAQIIEDIEIVNLELELGGIKKPTVYVLNLSEDKIGDTSVIRIIEAVKKKFGGEAISIPGKLEEEAIGLPALDKIEILKGYGEKEPGIERLIKHAYKILGLITFYTIKGGKEIHAWSLRGGSSALEAAGEVHTDFAKNFIKAEVISINDLLEIGSWKEAKEKGKVRLEGKDYEVLDGEVIEFKIGA